MKRALIGLLLLGASAQAHALASCVVATLPVAFSSYNPTSGSHNDTGQGTVSVTCTLLLGLSLLVSYEIKLSTGTGTFAQRQMAFGASRLNYNLYTNSGRSSIWGDGTGGTSTVSYSYTLGLPPNTDNYPVYGRIPKNQAVSAIGLYTDSITVTVVY